MTHPYIYEFGRFRFDPSEHALLRDGLPIALTEKAFQVLTVLVERSGHLVERSELVNAVWGGTFIEEGNLTVNISMLRKALGDDRGNNKLIETVAKRGYRFLPNVTRVPIVDAALPETTETTLQPCKSEPWRVPLALIQLCKAHPVATAFALALPVMGGFFAVQPHQHIAAAKTMPQVQRFVAVAPFTLTGANAADSRIGANVTEDLVGGIGRKAGLEARTVTEMSRSSRSGEANTPEATREVDALLTGLVDMKQGEARVSAKLANAEGETLWSGSYTGTPSEIPQLEGEIESTVSERMLDLSPAPEVTQRSHSLEAQRLYLTGRYFWNERTEVGLRRGIERFQQAIILDPNFAEAYAGLADSYAMLASYSVEPPAEAYPNAKAAAQKALQLDPRLAEGHTALGIVALYYEWNWKEAEEEFKKAIDLSPGNSGGYSWDSFYFAVVGDTSQALQQALKAQEMDPMSMGGIMHLACAYYWDRQYAKSEGMYRYALAQNANYARAHSGLGIVLAAEKDYAGALRELRETERLSGPDPYIDGLIGYAEALRGNVTAAHKVLDELTKRSAHEYVPPFSVAFVYLGLGDRNMALRWLDRARQDRSTFLIYAKVDPLLDPLRSDPRFDRLLTNIELTAQDAGRDDQMAEATGINSPSFMPAGMRWPDINHGVSGHVQ